MQDKKYFTRNLSLGTCFLKPSALSLGRQGRRHVKMTAVLFGVLGEQGVEGLIPWAHPNFPPTVLVTATEDDVFFCNPTGHANHATSVKVYTNYHGTGTVVRYQFHSPLGCVPTALRLVLCAAPPVGSSAIYIIA